MDAHLIVVSGKATKKKIALNLPTIIGRSREAQLTVAHPMVSRQHCEIYEEDGLLMLRDLGSLNGTLLEGQRISKAPVRPDAEFTVGPLTFRAEYEYEGDLDAVPPAKFVEEEAEPAAADEVPDFAFVDAPDGDRETTMADFDAMAAQSIVEPEELEPEEIEPEELEPEEIEPEEIEPEEIEPEEIDLDEIEGEPIEPPDVEPVEIEAAEVEPADVEPVIEVEGLDDMFDDEEEEEEPARPPPEAKKERPAEKAPAKPVEKKPAVDVEAVAEPIEEAAQPAKKPVAEAKAEKKAAKPPKAAAKAPEVDEKKKVDDLPDFFSNLDTDEKKPAPPEDDSALGDFLKNL